MEQFPAMIKDILYGVLPMYLCILLFEILIPHNATDKLKKMCYGVEILFYIAGFIMTIRECINISQNIHAEMYQWIGIGIMIIGVVAVGIFLYKKRTL